MTGTFPSHDPQNHFQPTLHTSLGTGKAHAKIILMGEHAVVYDQPAIALPFPSCQATVYVQATHSKVTTIDCPYHLGPLETAPSQLNNLKTAYALTLDAFSLPHKPLHLVIESSIPQERGMGSSAAVSVALIRALCDYYQQPLDGYNLRLITNEAEVLAHESTSGIDTLITSTYQPIIYSKSQQAHPFQLNLPAYLIVADSGQAGRTKEAVSHVAQLSKHKGRFVQEAVQTIGSFVKQAYQAIRDQEITELGRLMTYNHYYLNQLGVSNSRLDRIVNAAWLAGALGAKLTGGGMGGCVIALAPDLAHAQLVTESMIQAGAQQTWLLNLTKK